MRSGRFILLVALVFISLYANSVFAAGRYSEVSIVRTTIDSSGVEVNPYMSTFKLGYYFSKQLSFEFEYGTNLEDDESNDINVEIDKHTGIYARYAGDSAYNGVFFYFIAGSVKTELKFDGPSGEDSESVEDFAFGIGAEERSTTFQNLTYSLEYIRYADKDEGEISGISIGFRFHM